MQKIQNQFKLGILSLIVCFTVFTAAQAQDEPLEPAPVEGQSEERPPRGQGDGEIRKMFDEMVVALNLTEDQKTSFDAIVEKYRTQMQEVRQNNQGDFRAMRKEMGAIREGQEKELKEVLTEEQFEVYEEHMAEIQKKARGRMGRGRRGGRGGGF